MHHVFQLRRECGMPWGILIRIAAQLDCNTEAVCRQSMRECNCQTAPSMIRGEVRLGDLLPESDHPRWYPRAVLSQPARAGFPDRLATEDPLW